MSKFLGKFFGLGIDVRVCMEVKIWEMNEGNRHKSEKNNPSLGKCSVGYGL